jgi:hypothetical protein
MEMAKLFLEYSNLLGRDAVRAGRVLPTFRRIVVPPSSGSNSQRKEFFLDCLTLRRKKTTIHPTTTTHPERLGSSAKAL